MNKTVETQIINAEEQLRLAMLASDVSALNELLAPEIIITSHLGELLDISENYQKLAVAGFDRCVSSCYSQLAPT